MDEFDNYLWGMQEKKDELYNQYIDNINNIVDEYGNNEELEEKEQEEYDTKVVELNVVVSNKMVDELSARYNLDKKLCGWVVEQLCIEDLGTFGSNFLTAKRYASIAKFALDKSWKKER